MNITVYWKGASGTNYVFITVLNKFCNYECNLPNATTAGQNAAWYFDPSNTLAPRHYYAVKNYSSAQTISSGLLVTPGSISYLQVNLANSYGNQIANMINKGIVIND